MHGIILFVCLARHFLHMNARFFKVDMIAMYNSHSDFHLTVILHALWKLLKSPNNCISGQQKDLSEGKLFIHLTVIQIQSIFSSSE